MSSSKIQGGADMRSKQVRILSSSFVFLAALALLAAPAFAQEVFSVSQLAQQVRIEGLTETLGAIQLTATSPSGSTVKAGSSITVVYSAGITNLNASGTNNGVLTCSAGIAACANLTVGAVASGSTSLTISVGADTTFTNGSFILISQVRVNVNALGASATTVSATLSGTSSFPTTFPLTFVNGTVTVGSVVSPSLTSTFTAGSAVQTCSTVAGGNAFSLSVTERSPAALTTLADETSFTAGGGGVTVPVNGTSVIVVFSGVPSGMAIQYTGTSGATGGVALGAPAAAVQASTGGALTFSFPVTGSNTGVSGGITLGFALGTPNSGTTALTAGSIAAIGTTANVTAAVSIGPIQAVSAGPVSFAANSQGSGSVSTVGDCVTNLLFPFLTSQVGFDTSVTIANTSADKTAFATGGATPQTGTCTLTFYPTDLTTQTATAAGANGTTLQTTTPTIGAGGVYTFLHSTSTFKNQSGYMFAVCRFLDAHGFAFVMNGSPVTGTISQGLLAMVIPNNTIANGRVSTTATCTGAGCAVVPTGGNLSYEALSH
jgi:hypothetical protein